MRRTIVVLALLITATALANPIQDENAKPGTTQWQLATSRSADIEGFASLTSVDAGGTIRFFVTTSAPNFTLEIFRLGWYGGAGARRMTDPVTLTGHQQPVPVPDPATGLIECHWTDPYTLNVPAGWVSGVFFAKLTDANAHQNYVMFVVRNDARFSDLLFQSSVTTMNAYNPWGGKSLYPFNSTGPQASRVSFDRPYALGTGPTEFLRWEYPTIRFLEREGYDVAYETSIDTHENGALLLNHHAFLSVGHDEYWSWQMRTNVTAARDRGVSLGFLSSNTSYWQIRLEADADGVPDRTIVAYKENALSADPLATDGNPANDDLVTTAWRKPPVNMPEEELKGSMFTFTTQPVAGDIVVTNTSHWVFAGTSLMAGDRLPGLLGYEVDRMFSAYPPGTIQLAHSPFDNSGTPDFSDMTIYTAASGAIVFATGSMQWAYGLDDFNSAARGTAPPGGWVSAAAQQITRNVLDAFIANAPHPERKRRAVGLH